MPVNFSEEQTQIAGKPNEDLMSKIRRAYQQINFKLARVPLKEKLFFVQHLAVMLKAGISLSIALKTLAKQTTHKYFAYIINDVSLLVEKGTSLTESLRKHEKDFGELFINMIEAGELSGKLENVLAELHKQMKKQHELISKVKSAITYPVVILVAMIGIGAFVLIVVVPQMTGMFKELNAELPIPTQILIKVSDLLSQNLILFSIIAIIIIFLFIKIIKTEKGKYYFHKLLLVSPVFGMITKKINLANFARTISSLLKTDILIIKSFQITSNVLGNVHYRQAVFNMSEAVKKGKTISSVISEYPKLFPPIVSQMVAVGEETGEIDSILDELADFYETEVNQTMSNLPSLIEPLLIIFLGCGVGGMAVAIIMPMYSLSTSI